MLPAGSWNNAAELFRLDVVAFIRAPRFFPDSVSAAFFENHWAWWLGSAALAVVLLYLGLVRANRRMFASGVAVLSLTFLWIVAASLLVTSGERLYQAHTGLADAARQNDADAILNYFSRDFTIAALNILSDTSPAAARAELNKRLTEYGIKETKILNYRVTQTGSKGVTHFTAITQTSMGLVSSGWRVLWEDVPNEDWRITEAHLTRLGDRDVNENEVIP